MPQDDGRFTPLDEWKQAKFLRGLKSGIEPRDFLRFQIELQQEEGPPAWQLWLRRWRWPLSTMGVALVAASGCVWVGATGPESSRWPPIISGIGGGVFGSMVVAAVMSLLETKREWIRGIEDWKERRSDLADLESDVREWIESSRHEIGTMIVDLSDRLDAIGDHLEERVAGLGDQLQRLEDEYPS